MPHDIVDKSTISQDAKDKANGSFASVSFKTVTLCDIAAMTRSDLCALWRHWMKRDVPAMISQTMLRRILAHEAQMRQYGGLNRASKAALTRLHKQIHAPSGTPPKTSDKLRPGGQLLRAWNGQTHQVEVTETGFVWKGHHYKSLSAIARAITGAQWSGPRFFGLTGTSAGGSHDRA